MTQLSGHPERPKTNLPTEDLVFGLLQQLSAQPGVRVPVDARPVVFEMLPERTVRWSFTPDGDQLFQRRDVPDAPLRIVCEPKFVLHLLLAKNLTLHGQIGYRGDLTLLAPLAAALRPSKAALPFTEA